MTIVKRLEKGAPLSHQEMDGNFNQVIINTASIKSISQGVGTAFETRLMAMSEDPLPDDDIPFVVYDENVYNGQYRYSSSASSGYVLIASFGDNKEVLVNLTQVSTSLSGSVRTFNLELNEPVENTVTATIEGGSGNFVNGITRKDLKNRRIGSDGYQGGGYATFTLEAGTKYVEILQQNAVEEKVWDIHFIKPEPLEKILKSNLLDKTRVRNGVIAINAAEDDFDVISAANTYTYDYQEVEENTLYAFGYSVNTTFIRDQYFCYLDENKDLISYENLINQGARINEQWHGSYITTPANCKYIIYTVVNWDTLFTNYDTTDFVFCKFDDLQEAIANTQLNELNFPLIKESFEKKTNNLSFWVLGDSISATGYNAGSQPPLNYPITTNGGWTRFFIDKIRPRKWYNYSQGGATLTDDLATWSGGVLTTADNSFIARLEQAILDYDNGLIDPPDWLFITGCTNDMGANPTRYVTDTDIGSNDYDEYMESNFMTTDSGGYDNLELVDIESIDLSKIAGSVRYIVQRVGTIFPNCKFAVVTPYWDAAHVKVDQRKCVEEMRYMSRRLSIPVIDVQYNSNMPMIWDYKNNGTEPHRFLSDRVHSYFTDNTTTGTMPQGEFIANEFLKLIN